jgi:hypothetical protein
MARNEKGDEGDSLSLRPPRSHPKHPFDMSVATLSAYWYDGEMGISTNLWFPIDTTGYIPVKRKRASFEPKREPDEEQSKWRWRLALPV